MKKLLLIALVAILFTACSGNPLDKKFDGKTAKDDMKKVMPLLNQDEAIALQTAILYRILTAKSPEGTSYKELIAEGKKLMDENVDLGKVYEQGMNYTAPKPDSTAVKTLSQ